MTTWQEFADGGKPIDAIRARRAEFGEGFIEARDAVVAYCDRKAFEEERKKIRKSHRRMPVMLLSSGDILFALANDGSVWALDMPSGEPWQQIPDLPQPDETP